MKDLMNAMQEEKNYIVDKLNGNNTSLLVRLNPYGYNALSEYFDDKREYLFNQWTPDVIYIDVKTITTELEKAIKEERYGVYISTADSLYAFHGSDEIDYELCHELGISVAELYYNGGTIIGSDADLGIEIVAPIDIGLDGTYILNKFHEIISKYIDNVSIADNDILVNGQKIMGSMRRNVGKCFVWAAQISFANHSNLIAKVCKKQSVKVPSCIDINKLTKKDLEKEVLTWLLKQ